jgi:hypothetical protein
MDDFDAFIDYVDTTDEPGEVTVSASSMVSTPTCSDELGEGIQPSGLPCGEGSITMVRGQLTKFTP